MGDRFADIHRRMDSPLEQIVRSTAIRENTIIEECAAEAEKVSKMAAVVIRKLLREEGL